jgi:hypothetical protein
MMMDCRTGKTSILFVMLFISAALAIAAQYAEKPPALTVGYSPINYDQFPAWIVKETGLLRIS